MTFWDHLEELRKCLIRVSIALVGVTFVLFCFKDFLFDDLILAPSQDDFFLYRLLGVEFSLPLVNLEVAAQFMIHMKVTLVCALILTFPFLIYEIWKFIAPALYENEKKAVRYAFSFASSAIFPINGHIKHSVLPEPVPVDTKRSFPEIKDCNAFT